VAGLRRQICNAWPIASVALLGATASLAPLSAGHAEMPPTAAGPTKSPLVSRTDLQRHDLSISGREMIQARVDFEPGAIAPRHSHPGEEIVNVLRGTIEYRLDGKPAVTLKAGDVLFIPAGAIHGATNVGDDIASELATYIVEKGKPLITQAK
jgi:quercetin dioxygenase-like cupin family protein